MPQGEALGHADGEAKEVSEEIGLRPGTEEPEQRDAYPSVSQARRPGIWSALSVPRAPKTAVDAPTDHDSRR